MHFGTIHFGGQSVLFERALILPASVCHEEQGCVKCPLLNFVVNQVLDFNAVGNIGWVDEWTHPASAERSQFKGSEAEDGLSSLQSRVFCKCLNLSTAQV